MKRFAALVFVWLPLVGMTLPSEASVMVYRITQVGWFQVGFPRIPSGGKIVGSFSGEDLNNNGVIELVNNEVTSYLVKFKDSIFTPDFTHTLDDLLFFEYTIGSPGFPPSFPLFSAGGGFGYDADDGVIVRLPGFTALEATDQPALVPEPTTIALLGLGLAGLGTARRRHNV